MLFHPIQNEIRQPKERRTKKRIEKENNIKHSDFQTNIRTTRRQIR